MPKRKTEPKIKAPKIEKLPSGAYHTRVLIDNRRVSITKATEDECLAEYMAIKHGIIEAKPAKDQPYKTLADAVEEYIDARVGKRSPSTIAGYKKNLANTFQGAMKWDVYTTSDRQWQTAIDRERKLGRSPKYIKNAWGLMSAAIEETAGHRPKVMLYPPAPKPRAWLDYEQIKIFVAAIKDTPVEIPALLCLSSLRRSEMIALKWENIDFAHKVIHVQGAIVPGENGGMVEKPQNKTQKSRRTVPLIPPAEEALLRAERKRPYVVTMSVSAIFNQIKKVCEENNLPPVGMHGLRHSFASLAYHLGIPEMIAAEIGGWADLGTMHNIYTHLAESDIANRAQEFQDFFKIGNGIGNEK